MSDVPANDPAYQPIPGAAPEVDLGPELPASGPTTVIHGDRNVTYTQPQVTTPHLQAADYPSESGIYNKEDAARAAGYSWQDIDAHIGPAQVAAQDAGYTQDEINQYLGYASPDAMVSRNTDTWAQVQHYDPKTLQPASDGTFDLTANPNWKGDYAAALLRGEVKGPKDFADQYVVSAMRASGQPPTDPLLAAGAASADKLAAQLPGRRDLTDAALSLGGDFQNNQQNLLDHWEGTGENPLAAAIRAQTDPALRAGLIFDNTHTLPIFERHLQNIAEAARQGVEDVYGSDLAGGAADWGADGKDPNIFHLLAYIAAKDVDALSRTIFQAPAIALARGGAQSLREMGMSEGGADDAMRDALALAQSIAGGDVRVGPAGELRASGGGFEPFPDRAFGPRPPGPVTDIGGEGMLAPPLRQLPAPLRALTEIPIDKIDLAKPTEEAITQVPASEAFKPVGPAERGPIIAYHGTPHTFEPEEEAPFGNFRIENVGTGQGAQTYGYGVYTAESSQVAASYREKLSQSKLIDKAREAYDEFDNPADAEAQLLENPDLTPADHELLASLKEDDWLGFDFPHQAVSAAFKEPEQFDISPRTQAALDNMGSMYKVQINAHPNNFLDLDKTLGEQSPEVAAAVKDYLNPNGTNPIPFPADVNARDWLDGIESYEGNAKNVSDALAQRGVKGTRYFDQLSRYSDLVEPEGAPSTRNYVVFNPKDMQILERNGELPKQEFAETATPAEKLQALAKEHIETNTKANMADVLNAKADQLETMRLTREGHLPDEFDRPNFFQNLAKNEDPATQELAKGYDTATALRNFFGQVIPDALKDITGAQPNPLLANAAPRFRYREQVAAGEDYVTRLMVGPINVQTARVGAILDKHILDFAPHMQEWNDSLDALEQGRPGLPPENSVIGKFIGHMQGIPGFILDRNDKFSKIADELKNVNEFAYGWLQWAADNGMMDQPGYIRNYFRQRWTKPNEADRIFGGGGRAGDTSGTKKRTIPNWFDGLRAGLIPRDRDPLKIVLQDVTGKLRLANHANMLQTMMNEGWVRTADKSQPGDIRLNYWGKELYAQPGLAKIYNRWANMRDLPPGLEKAADFLNQVKNTSVGLKLLFPIWHTLLVTKELLASGYARAWDELTHGEFERAASSIVSSTAVIPRFIEIARADKARMARYLDFGSLAPGQKSTDRVVQLIVNAGSQMGPRQASYRAGYRQNLQGSIAAGRTFGQYVADLAQNKQVLGTLVNDIRESWKPAMTFDANGKSTMTPKTALAIPGLALHELGTAVTSVGGPLFDQLIPMMRRAVIFENADALLRHNINASDEYLTKRLTQVVKNTDDRYGEMQQETLFWPRWARMIANATMISTSFFYGTFRWALNSVGIKSISRRGGIHMEWNPIATKSLIALGLVTAISNTMYQKLKTGEWPHGLLDLEFPHPVAGQPGRVQGPGQDKEFVDWAKIAVNATSAGIDNGWGAALMATTTELYSYATGKEYDVPDLLRTFETGENPIGLRPGYMPGFGGGLPGMIIRQLAPMLLTNPDEISAALKLSWLEKLILREAPKWAEDWNAWRGDATHGQIGLHRGWTAQMIKRARQDAQRTGVPFDQ